MKELLGHRLSSTSSQEAKVEWGDIVEGEHKLWSRVSDPYKHTIRAFLVNFHTHVLLHTTESFSYRNGSIGAAAAFTVQSLLPGVTRRLPSLSRA